MLRPAFLLLLTLTASPLLARMTDIASEMEQVTKIRGVEFRGKVDQKTITRAQFRDFLKVQINENLPLPIDEYFEVLRSLYLLGDERDPLKKLFDLYEAQVLAFYDARTHIYYSLDKPPAAMEKTPVPESAVVIHELMHALQDQRFNAWQTMEKRKLDWDSSLAYQAVLEGEATLVMMAGLFQSMGLDLDTVVRDDTVLQLLADPSQFRTGVPEDAPPYFVDSMIFPYVEGLKFVIQAYRRGGWPAVDALHEKPPMSTEEVLHPEIYFGRPTKTTSTKAVASSALIETPLGEFHWKFLLDPEAAKGWESDKVRVVRGLDGNRTVFIDSTWDSEKDAKEFSDAINGFLTKRDAEPSVRTRGRRVLVAFGKDQKAIRKFVR